MEPLFSEMEPLLQEICKKLNDMCIQRTAPKVKTARTLPEARTKLSVNFASARELESKAGKHLFRVNVGEVGNLYNTSSKNRKVLSFHTSTSPDLHVHTAEQALDALNSNLQVWIDKAMEGLYPFVIQVEIICGKGYQILSEVVEKWIKVRIRFRLQMLLNASTETIMCKSTYYSQLLLIT